jgi:Tfp pilus assembly protein PilV
MLENHSNYDANNRHAFRALGKGWMRQGFTLFEVSISLVLVAFGVISVMMLFPIGIKAEQMARMRIFAAVKAEELLDSFATLPKDNPGSNYSGPIRRFTH